MSTTSNAEIKRKEPNDSNEDDIKESFVKSKKARRSSESDSDNHNASKESNKSTKKDIIEIETDPVVLQRRQKQIDYGKNTVGYSNYIQQVSIGQRTREHPVTPDKYCKYSRRSWDTLIKIWRKKLHAYDLTTQENDQIDIEDNAS